MRRGDYREFRAGRWFYSVSQYRDIVAELTSLFPRTSVGLLVATDDSGSLEMLMSDHRAMKVANVCAGPGDAIGDLYSLAQCDFIVGPPSTYSMWASFYGQTPRYTLWAPEAPKSLAQFKVEEGLVFTG